MQSILSFASVTTSAFAFQPFSSTACLAGFLDRVRAFALGYAFRRTQAEETNGIYSVSNIALITLYAVAEKILPRDL